MVPERSFCKADNEFTPLGEGECFTKADASLGREVRAPETELGVRLKRWEHMNSHGRECGVRKMMTAEDKAFGDTYSWGAGRERIQEEMEQQEREVVPLFSRAAPPLSPSPFLP